MGPDRATPATKRSAGLAPRKPIRVEPPHTPRLALRPLTPEDRAPFIETVRRSREMLDRWAPLHREGESDESLFERQLWLTQEGDRTGRALRRIATLDDGVIAGAFNLPVISRGLATRADMNWWIASDLAGQGLATRGVRILLDHATDDLPRGLGIHVVEAAIRQDNLASIRVAEKAGFVHNAEDRTYLHAGNDWILHDIYVYRLGATG